MKRFSVLMLTIGLLLTVSIAQAMAVNVKSTVVQVTTAITISNDVDYIISSATPFGEEGVVDIANTEHAVLILANVKPSKAIPLLAAHVKINGAKAVNNNNCQVKLYNRGTIILPYASTIKPLTVYSEQNFNGESCNNFGLGNTGGFMNTMNAEQLNNKVRSFKLKRGYMVTFSLRSGGRGYSRCFIAANSDLEIATLPAVMDQKISSYRVFKWYDTGKQQLAAAGGDTDACSKLNVTSTYTWGTAGSMGPDVENVPHHIYENYPSPSALGGCTSSPHMKTNNEPMNPADDPKEKTESVDQVLANWEELMRTGMRLCSPSSWDGSDYTNGTGYIKRFIDSIDARGWRCDIIDLHCYWPEGNFNTIKNWTNSTGRPVWISEWVWGASWNSNGAFASGVTEQQNADALKRICPVLNANDCIERYYYWNGERDPSRLVKYNSQKQANELTVAGQYYATINSGLGYNGKYDFVPTTPKQYGPSNYSAEIIDGVLRLKWHDANGEFNQLMEIQKKDETGKWITFKVIEQNEEAADYTYDIMEDINGNYRLHLIDLSGKDFYSSDDLEPGDQIDMNGKVMYVGGNMVTNGDFNLGFTGWTNGKGNSIAAPYFEILPMGGVADGAYLQSYNNGDGSSEYSAKQVVDIQANTDYYFRTAVCNANSNPRFCLSTDGTAESRVITLMKSSTTWIRVGASFNSQGYTKALMSFRNLLSKSQIDRVELRQLFESREEAIANGVELAKAEARALADYYTAYPSLSTELKDIVNGINGTDSQALMIIDNAVKQFTKATKGMQQLAVYSQMLDGVSSLKCYKYDELRALIDDAEKSSNANVVIELLEQLQLLFSQYLPFTKSPIQPKSPTFTTATGWETKVGTYTAGDQRLNTIDGVSCWNAWWSLTAADNPNASMEIRQTITGLPKGYYTMLCKATTEHYCTTDQHGYLTYGDETVTTPTLSYDYFDLPVENIWESLTTQPIFVDEGGSVTIGFKGTKSGAVDGLWHRYGSSNAGDNREGWWCATDFVLNYHPLYTRQVVPNEWNVICLPYAARPSAGMKFYEIAGITPDYTQFCLEEKEEVGAGVPFIFKSSLTNACFYEYGESVTRPSEGTGNMRGFFVISTSAPQGFYFLQNGEWVKITDSTNPPMMTSYTALIRPFNGTGSKHIDVIDNWQGETMPVVGVTEDEKSANDALGISSITNTSLPAGYYDINGRAIEGEPMQKGVIIKVENGTAQKVVVR